MDSDPENRDLAKSFYLVTLERVQQKRKLHLEYVGQTLSKSEEEGGPPSQKK
jgi:hypothetical protein